MPGRYTLEVTSPGLERALRTPAHFQREVGKTVAIRLADVGARPSGGSRASLEAADDRRPSTVRIDDGDERTHRSTTRSTGPRRCSSGDRHPSPASARSSRRRGSSRHEQPRHDRSGPDAGRTRRTSPSTRCCTCWSTPWPPPTSAARTRPTRSMVEVDPDTMEFTLHRLRRRRGRQLGQRARRHARAGGARAASPPRPSAR